ncbi:hypothetical protein KCP69_25565 [Salmonella enterica subsp. enterica]|nr:hypothetical protein KCP69_25565 [Salmonella enterica subsp. enterica]
MGAEKMRAGFQPLSLLQLPGTVTPSRDGDFTCGIPLFAPFEGNASRVGFPASFRRIYSIFWRKTRYQNFLRAGLLNRVLPGKAMFLKSHGFGQSVRR